MTWGVKVDKNGTVWMGWDAADAIEIGYVLQDAGTRSGSIVDRGFWDDGAALIEAADKVLHPPESDEWGLRLGVILEGEDGGVELK